MDPGGETARRERLKQAVARGVDERAGLLAAVAADLHAHPELGFAEHHAASVLTGHLRAEGWTVTDAAGDLPTAFVARRGRGSPTVAVLCEYDALPSIGHACGHNLIAAAGLGAGLAAGAVASEAGGSVVVVGTPAEEGGGGKVFLAEAGVFDGVDAALMVHPADADLTTMSTLAVRRLLARYEGRASHAAAAPHHGRNALDAAVLGYNAVAALRQHLRADERVHGVFRDGGAQPNVVPAHASTEWYVRAGTRRLLAELCPRVVACLEAGALAAGCTVEIDWIEPAFDEIVPNEPLVDAYVANAARRGRRVVAPTPGREVVGSTDLGNLSYRLPCIHPMVSVAPPGTPIHTEAFADCAGSPEATPAVLDAAAALAMTVVDVWCEAGLAERAWETWRAQCTARGADVCAEATAPTGGGAPGAPRRAREQHPA